MPLQDKVYDLGVAKAGQVLKGLHSNFISYSAPAKDDSVCAGCFVQSDGKFVKGASGNAITGKIMGIALSNEYFTSDVATQNYPTNRIVTFAHKGCIAIETESVANVGQYVFLKNDNGALAFDNTKEKAGHTYTGFIVVYPSSSNVTDPEIIGIENE